MNIDISNIESAAKRLDGIAHKTPLIRSNFLSDFAGTDVYLKCENFQKTGSFKIRGAYNKISKIKDTINKDEQIITASAGNHAQGVAHAATLCNLKSTVVMPKHAPIAKINATKGYGANVLLRGECFDEANDYAKSIDGIFVHPYDDIDIIAGQGTIGLEIIEQLADADIVLAPAGGGGLLAGVAFAIKQINKNISVIGVQAEQADALLQSFKAKKLITTDDSNTLADGIAVKNPGKITTKIINKYVDDIISLSDYDIASTVLQLMERCKLVAEPAGAASAAAILNNKIKCKNKKVVCLISGGNIDGVTISDILERGLIAGYRKVEFVLKAPDSPETAKDLINTIVEEGANIISLEIDKLLKKSDIGYERIYVCCEIDGKQHYKVIKEKLQNNGYIIN